MNMPRGRSIFFGLTALGLLAGSCKPSDKPETRDMAPAVNLDGAVVDTPSAQTPGPDMSAVAMDAQREAPRDMPPADGPACPTVTEAACDPLRTQALAALGPPRKRYCALDIGSKNVKLVIGSLIPGMRATFDGERTCKVAQNLGAKTIDATTQMGKPLLEADMDALVKFIRDDYLSLCTSDQGTMLGAVATEWARKATNQAAITMWFKSKLNLDLKILTPDEEGTFGYIAGSKGTPNKIVLDTGSQSFQISFRHMADPPAPSVIKIALGSQAAGMLFFSNPTYPTYKLAREAFLTDLRTRVTDPAVEPVRAKLAMYILDNKLDKELVSLGESSILLAMAGRLRGANGHWVDAPTYRKELDKWAMERAMGMPQPKALMLADAMQFIADLDANPQWVAELRDPCISGVYGHKVMMFPVLVADIIRALGLAPRVAFSSGELGDGFLIETAQ